jgi:ParB family chromosome partitioning protein
MSKSTNEPRKVLARGLSSLLPAAAPAAQAPVEPNSLPIDLIDPNPEQPRSIFKPEKIRELADSIRANGIVQPLVVQHSGTRYTLIAGERRWRAAREAGLTEVPVVIRDFAPDRILEVALIENIQREDLNPIEVAQALDRLLLDHHLTHEELAQRTGKDRSTITNLLRLLKLPAEVQQLLAEQRLSMGHARAILGIPDPDLQIKLAEKAVSQGMSVRQVERAVQESSKPRDPKDAPLPEDPNVRAAVDELERALGTRVRIIERTSDRGRIEIEYYSKGELQRLFETLTAS